MAVVVNPSSGLAREGVPKNDIAAAFAAVGLEPEIVVIEEGLDVHGFVTDRVRKRFSAVVASGGDGTVSAVGSALTGSQTALGVLPTGTLNHFAKDMSLPLNLADAVQVIARGHTTAVDVGEVNGRFFLNNSSIGLYPTIVSERERLMERGVGKAPAMCRAILTALWRFPETRIRLTTAQAGLVTRTPFLFVGNNEYEFSGLQAGSRARLCDGLLQLCTLADTSRLSLFKAAVFAIIGRIDAAPAVVTADTKWARIETLRRSVKVALDGEIVRLTSPLVYSIHPAALNVIVSSQDAQKEAECVP